MFKYRPILVHIKYSSASTYKVYHYRLIWYTETFQYRPILGTQKTFQYRPILVHEKSSSIDRYWYTFVVPVYTFVVLVSTDTGTLLSYQYRLVHFCRTSTYRPILGRTSIDRYWYNFTFQYRTILPYQYLGSNMPKVHFFQNTEEHSKPIWLFHDHYQDYYFSFKG